MNIPGGAFVPIAPPASRRVSPLSAQVTPPAKTAWHHVEGSVKGRVLRYSDLNSFAWYEPFFR